MKAPLWNSCIHSAFRILKYRNTLKIHENKAISQAKQQHLTQKPRPPLLSPSVTYPIVPDMPLVPDFIGFTMIYMVHGRVWFGTEVAHKIYSNYRYSTCSCLHGPHPHPQGLTHTHTDNTHKNDNISQTQPQINTKTEHTQTNSIHTETDSPTTNRHTHTHH